MSFALRTVTCVVSFVFLTFRPVTGAPFEKFEEPLASVEVTDEELLLETALSGPFRQVRLRVMNADSQLVCDALSTGERLSWSPPADAPNGYYRWEVTVIGDDLSSVSKHEKSDGERDGVAQQRIRGGFQLSNLGLQVIDSTGPNRKSRGSAIEESEAQNLHAGVAADPGFDLVQTFNEDIGINDSTPAVYYNDTDVLNPTYEWKTEVTSVGENMLPSFFSITDEVNSVDIVSLTTSAEGGNSFSTDSQGDVSIADGDLFVDRSENRVGINTTLPPDDLSILDIQPVVHLEDSDSSKNSSTGANFRGGLAVHEDELWLFTREGVDGILYWPFVIRGVPFDYSLTIRSQNSDPMVEGEGYVGMGTHDPQAKVHVFSYDNQAKILVEETATPQAVRTQFQLKNNGAPRFALENTFSGIEWGFQQSGPGNFLISKNGTGGPEMQVFQNGRVRMGPGGRSNFDLDPSGNLKITGSLTTQGSSFPDYVFEPDYPLMSLTELRGFIEREQRLPDIPSAAEVERQGGHNVTELQLKMLEKIEELTLYLLEKDKEIQLLRARLEKLETGISGAGRADTRVRPYLK